MRMSKFLVLTILVVAASQVSLADTTYTFVSTAFDQDISFNFTVPTYLTTTTSVPIGSLQNFVASGVVAGQTLTNFTIKNPLGGNSAEIDFTFSSGILTEEFNWPSPFDHDGFYDHGDANLTITSTPEPGSLALLGSGLIGLGGLVRRKLIA